MEPITKFKEAAKDLQNTQVYKNLEAAREKEEGDTALQAMLAEFSQLRMELNEEMNKPERDAEKITEANARITELYNNIMSNENMVAFNHAKKEIETFIDYVSEVLNVAISGGDPMTVEPPKAEGCDTEGCSSCAGCG